MRQEQVKNRLKRGFTLVEVTIVIAVLMIVAAIAIPSLQKLMVDMEMAKVNNAAKQIYLASQNHMVSMRTAGTLQNDVAGSAELQPIRIGTSDLVFADSSKTVMDSYILPVGTITDEVRHGGEYVVIFDKKFGLLQEVYYSERGLSGGGTVDSSALARWRSSESERRDERVGYYNGVGDAAAIVDQLPPLKLEMKNGEELYAEVTLPELPGSLGTSDVQVIFRVENAEAATQVVEWRLTPETTDFDKSDTGSRIYTKTLDSLNKGFSAVCVDALGVCPIAVGANVKVTATLSLLPGVATPGVTYRDSTSVVQTASSLFSSARAESGSDGKRYYSAEITSGRHLSNLNLVTNPSVAIAGTDSVFYARQMGNIDFGSASAWQTVYGTRKTPMIRNPSLLTYDGMNNALVNITQPLFKVFGETPWANEAGLPTPTRWDYRLQNVRLISPKITDFLVPADNPYFGALAGAASGATIENCKIYGTDTKLEVADFQQTGGLVGLAYGTAVLNSSVAIPMMTVIPGARGDSTIGGLIGAFYLPVFNASTLVSGCFVDIGTLFVSNPNRKGGTVGMLIGYNWQGATIDNCYVVGSIIGNPPRACGLIGSALATNTFANEHIYNCYVLVDLYNASPDLNAKFAAFGSDPRKVPTHVSNIYYVEDVAGLYAARDAAKRSTPITLDQLRAGKIGDKALFSDPASWKFGGTTAEPFTPSLGTTYPYPGLNSMGIHQGDWPK